MDIDENIIKGMVKMSLSEDIDNHMLLQGIVQNQPYNEDRALIVLLCMASMYPNNEDSIYSFLYNKYEMLWEEFCENFEELWKPYEIKKLGYFLIEYDKCIEIYNKLKQIEWKTSII